MLEYLDRTRALTLRTEMEMAAKTIAAKYGLGHAIGKVSFDSKTCKISVELATVNGDGVVNTERARDFQFWAPRIGLKSEHLGAEFVSGRKRFKITGYNSRAHRTPVLADCLTDGKSYRFTAAGVKAALGV